MEESVRTDAADLDEWDELEELDEDEEEEGWSADNLYWGLYQLCYFPTDPASTSLAEVFEHYNIDWQKIRQER